MEDSDDAEDSDNEEDSEYEEEATDDNKVSLSFPSYAASILTSCRFAKRTVTKWKSSKPTI